MTVIGELKLLSALADGAQPKQAIIRRNDHVHLARLFIRRPSRSVRSPRQTPPFRAAFASFHYGTPTLLDTAQFCAEPCPRPTIQPHPRLYPLFSVAPLVIFNVRRPPSIQRHAQGRLPLRCLLVHGWSVSIYCKRTAC